MSDHDLHHIRVLVTGGTSGLGRALVVAAQPLAIAAPEGLLQAPPGGVIRPGHRPRRGEQRDPLLLGETGEEPAVARHRLEDLETGPQLVGIHHRPGNVACAGLITT